MSHVLVFSGKKQRGPQSEFIEFSYLGGKEKIYHLSNNWRTLKEQKRRERHFVPIRRYGWYLGRCHREFDEEFFFSQVSGSKFTD